MVRYGHSGLAKLSHPLCPLIETDSSVEYTRCEVRMEIDEAQSSLPVSTNSMVSMTPSFLPCLWPIL